ncbi:Low molecular weight protein tyrosine phosphatase (EC [uncultured Gammaproteobacteria bacterium]|nr:Low molecular weight protein tyrosine phosphatase (EC [uncultured Gammaproteobacteria bacterium]
MGKNWILLIIPIYAKVSQNINGVHYLLNKLGLSWISARSNIQNKTKKRKRYIKNFKQKAIDVLPTDTDLNKVDVWFQDETRMGNKVLSPEYGQKKVLDLEQFVSSNLNTDIFLVLYVQLKIKR